MKFKLFIVAILFVLTGCFAAQTASAFSISLAPLARQMEIIKQEILALKSLIENFNSTKEVSAASYVAEDLSSGKILLSKNTEDQHPIASVTKLMTAVVSLENIDMDEKITLTDKMLSPFGESSCLYAGLKISAKDLLKAMLVQSSNDAAQALSYFLGNEKFVKKMNKKAKDLDMENTVYYDVHGLSKDNQSTAKDLAKLVSYINKNYPEIWNNAKNNNFWLADASGQMLKFQNLNNFYYLDDFVGGKTGYTDQAKETLASVFEVNGKQVAITLLYSENRMSDTFNILKQLKKIK